MNKILKLEKIYYLLGISFLLRILVFYTLGDTRLVDEWGIIVNNFKISGVFGFNVVVNDFIALPKYAEPGEEVLPTIFMPPLYFYFIYLTEFLSGSYVNSVSVIIYVQIILSLLSTYLIYKIILMLKHKKNFALLLTAIFSLFPIHVFSSSQISSITVQILLLISYFFFLLKFDDNRKFFYLILFSVIAGLMMLIRGEFFLFYFLTLIYFFIFKEKKFKSFVISIIFSILVLSPYLKRNYDNFSTLTLTKSFGYNLLKGNNPSFKAEGDSTYIEENFDRKALNIKTDNNYEINLDNLYRDKAINLILNDPFNYFILYIKKIFSFIFIDFNSSYPNYYNFLHIFPKIFISILSLFGAIISLRKKGFFQFLSIYYISNILLFSIFFILPRYSLILLPVQLLLSIEAFKYLKGKLFN
ncbi:MAG: glycosyltransferase family 39 protein [Pseudomonadota bacterium]|nr:glycosyltransferase family 39 protein [Pseudomonadota bacterium]